MKQVLRKSLVFSLILALCVLLLATFATTEAQAASKTHLKKTSLVMTTGETYQQRLLTSGNKIIAASKVKWSSNNSKVAKVSRTGKVTAVKKGTTTIKAKYNGKTYRCKVKVRDASLYYVPGEVCVVGGRMQMCMWGTGGEIDTSKAKWKSSNRNVLTVDSKGLVKGISVGTATVYATYLNHQYSCKVSVERAFFDNVTIKSPSYDKRLVEFCYITNCPKAIKVELDEGSELVKVFHKNLESGHNWNNRYASIYCYPNATGQVKLKVYTVSEPGAYYLFKLNFKNGEYIGEGDLPGGLQEGNSPTSTPPTYSDAGIPDFGSFSGNSLALQEVVNEKTRGYQYNIYGNNETMILDVMSICAQYRDVLISYGWNLFATQENSKGGLMYGLEKNGYRVGLEWFPYGTGYYKVNVMIMKM